VLTQPAFFFSLKKTWISSASDAQACGGGGVKVFEKAVDQKLKNVLEKHLNSLSSL
jgi:hypothetical protein